MSASRRPAVGSGKRALVALAMGAIASPLAIGLTAGSASAAVDITTACSEAAFDDAGFRDIAGQNAQFRLAINCLAALGITTGQSSTEFNPTGSITRAQFAQFLFRLGNLVEFDWDTTGAGFEDLGGVSGEARNAINALRNAGVVNGVTEDMYNPLGQVRRDQMATFLVQFYENVLGDEMPGNATNAFMDDNGNVHEANINAIAAADIADGVAAGQYAPNRPVTRAQMAAFVAREIQVAINEDLIPPLFDQPAQEPTVTVGNQGNVTAGAEFTGTFADLPRGARVTVSGAGMTNQAVTTDANGAFTIALPANAPTGAQTLTFTITLADGRTITVTADVNVAAGTTVAVGDQGNVTAGAEATGTFTGLPEGSTVTVTGAGITTAQTVTVGTNGAFTVQLPAGGPTGAQMLTFVIMTQDGERIEVTANITVAAPQSATVRPELVSAQIVSTTTTINATPDNPAGTMVRYTFDEPIIGGTAAPRAGAFNIYNNDGTPAAAGTGNIVSSDGRDVVVRFTGVTTAEAAQVLTLATVDANAVTDTQGVVNPEGDAPIGTSGGGDTTLAAGITVAPDLVSVGGFRQGATAGTTAVDFTFDEAAFTTGTGAFRLVLVNNPTGATGNENVCTGPVATDTTAGGGTVAGGNGTTTITVVCTNPGITTDNPNGNPITADQVARGTVDPGTVSDEQQIVGGTPDNVEGRVNPMSAAEVANNGNTFEPDLVSVEFRPGATTADVDRALFTFDAEVATATAASFAVYGDAGTPLAATAVAGTGTAAINPQNARQVLVEFTTTAVDRAVGGFVTDGAVSTAATATTVALSNEQDEVGVANTLAGTVQTPGRTQDPDLTGVALIQGEATTDQFGNVTPGTFQATYTFDEPVTATPAVGEFSLYLADGTQLVATTCATGTVTTGTGQNDNTVTCTAFTIGANAATSVQIGNATLGTVDNAAVAALDAGGVNPEGAELTTGGTGTRTL
jgi:hypothetical protein